MSDIIYPGNCKPLTEDLGPDELLRRLKALAHTFQALGQSTNETYSHLIPLALHLAEEQYLQHSSRDVQLLVACIIADTLRVFAPEAPYKNQNKIREIFLFMITQFNGLKDPKDPAFKRYFYLLENLAYVKSFNMCFELEDCQQLFCSLFNTFFKLVSEEHSAKVKSFMMEILCPIIIESDNVSTELLDTILINIVEPYKSQRKHAYQLAKELIVKTHESLKEYVKIFFNQILVTDTIDKKYSIYNKVWDLIYELNSLDPKIMTDSLPQIEVKLKSPKQAERERAVICLARMFSEPKSELSSLYPLLWKQFISRFNDIAISIRYKCVQSSMHFLVNQPNTRKEIIECLRQRQHDADEGIRYGVVISIVETAKRSFKVVAESIDLLQFVRERTLDKKFKIRKEALTGLAWIYRTYVMDSNSVQPADNAIHWIKNKILHGYYMPSAEDRLLVERLLITSLVPYQLPPESRMISLYHLLGSIDDNAIKAFIELQKNQMRVRKLVGDWVKLHKTEKTEKIQQQINLKSQAISRELPDTVKAHEFVVKFSQQLRQEPLVLGYMEKLLKKDISCKECADTMSVLLRKMGQPIMSNVYYNVIKAILERMASVMVDKESIEILVKLIEDCIKKNDRVLEVRLDVETAGEKGLQLLTVLSYCFPAYFQHEPTLSHMISLLNYDTSALSYVPCQVLKIFTHLGKFVPIQQKYPNIYERLIPICKNFAKTGSPKQAKHGVRCIFVNSADETVPLRIFTEIIDTFKDNLNLENCYCRTAIVALGHISQNMPSQFAIQIKNFVARKLVKDLLIKKVAENRIIVPPGNWCTEDEIPEETQCKIEALKAMARWLIGLKNDTIAAEKTFRMMNAIILRNGNLLQEVGLTEAEKVWLRLSAGKAMLKICEQKGVGDQFIAEQYLCLSRLMTDPVTEAREQFARKLHKGLSKAACSNALPLDFMGFYALGGLEPDKRLIKIFHEYIESDVKSRRELANIAKGRANYAQLTPDNMLIFAIAILTQCETFVDFTETKTLQLVEKCLRPIIIALMMDKKAFSYNLCKNTLSKIKLHKYFQDKEDSEKYSVRMWTICDVAMNYIDLKTKSCDPINEGIPPELALPEMFFKSLPNFENTKNYLPAEYLASKESIPNKVPGLNKKVPAPTGSKRRISGNIENDTINEQGDVSVADPTMNNNNPRTSSEIMNLGNEVEEDQRDELDVQEHQGEEVSDKESPSSMSAAEAEENSTNGENGESPAAKRIRTTPN